MFKYLKALYDILKNYHLYSIPILFNETIFHFKYNSVFNKFKYLNSDFLSDSIPCPYFFLKKIKKFIIIKNIKSTCDLGSGFGKILYYLGTMNNFKIDGIEIDKEIFLDSVKLENSKIKIFNENILEFDINNTKYDLFVINDPLKKTEDLKKLIFKIKGSYKQVFLVFINLNLEKLSLVSDNLKLLDQLIITKNRNILFCSLN
tara:strand:+ start:1296 stop:1904 length:609 start_codon:yes stop_codon:yes gene_type:complete